MKEALERIEAFFKNNPSIEGQPFGEPAPESEIESAEMTLGVDYPDDYREFLGLHNGARMITQKNGVAQSAPFIRNLELLPLLPSLDEWQAMNDIDGAMDGIDPEGPVKPFFWNPRWVPIALLFGSTQFHCLDLDPDEGGTVGQVIWVADDDERRLVVAPDFASYLEMLADGLEGEKVSEDENGVELPDDFWNQMT